METEAATVPPEGPWYGTRVYLCHGIDSSKFSMPWYSSTTMVQCSYHGILLYQYHWYHEVPVLLVAS
jgi:hypothetical protein